ncbi:hypothetical protein [Microbacterium sp. GXF7504]
MHEVRAVPPVVAAWGPVLDRWRDAVSGGRFFTWWSALVALPVSATILALYGRPDDLHEVATAMVLSAIGWVPCFLLVLPAAIAERRLRSPIARGVTVVGTTLVVSVLRPLLNDLLVRSWTDWPVTGDLPLRMLMNAVVWLVLLSMVAVAVEASDTANRVNRRMRAALAALAGGDISTGLQARRARARVVAVVEELRARAAELRTGVVDFERVRTFSDAVRQASHDLDEFADNGLPTDGVRTRPSFLARLEPPPVGLVAAAFTFASLPYGLRTLPPWTVALGALVVFGVTAAGELLAWFIAAKRTPRVRGILVICCSLVTGTAVPLALLAVAGEGELIWMIPVPAIPALTILAAFAEGAFRRAETEQRVLTEALWAIRATGSGRPEPTTELVHRAADTLHGEVQSRCVVFAAGIEDEPATPAQVEEFIRSIGQRLDRVLAPREEDDEDPFRALVDAWSPVLRIRTEIDAAASADLADRTTSRRVADVVSEAFVNAVKHAAARDAEVTVRDAGGGVLGVRVATPGRLRTRLRAGMGLVRLGVPTRLAQDGHRVVLAAAVPTTRMTTPPPPSVGDGGGGADDDWRQRA